MTNGLAQAGADIVDIDMEGVAGWVRGADVDALLAADPPTSVRLLPGFDPFINELPRRVDAVLPDAHHDRVHRTAGWVSAVVLVDGRVGGTWEIEPGKGGAGKVVVEPFIRWRGDAKRELQAEADRIGAYLERPLKVEVNALP